MRWRPSPTTIATVLVAALLAGTAQERTLGIVSDEQQLAGTALALAGGELGLPRGAAFGVERAEGDAVSPYGILWPLALAPLMRPAIAADVRFGSGAGQSVLILLPLACVLLASWLAGRVARGLGAGPSGQAMAILATGAASFLWPLGSTLFTEPLQAVLLAATAALAIEAVQPDRVAWSRRAALAGCLASALVLAKSVNLAIAPLALLPLLLAPGARWRRVAAAAAGAAPGLAAWLALELVRFGSPLASYGGQRFSHPVLEGMARLLVSPNEGLLIYFPPAALGLVGLVRIVRQPVARVAAIGVLLPVLALLPIVGAWWAWDGSAGWGPRLLAPAVPLIAAGFGAAVETGWRRLAGAALLALGLAVNLAGALQPEVAVMFYVDSTGPARVPEELVERFPDGLAAAPPGQRFVSRSMVAVKDSAFAPPRLHAFVIAARLAPLDRAEREGLLVGSAPWRERHEELAPVLRSVPAQISGVLHESLVSDFAWPHLGAALLEDRSRRRLGFCDAAADALHDQVLRAFDLRRPDEAASLSATLLRARPDAIAVTWHAESLRLGGKRDRLDTLLGALVPDVLQSPEMRAERALMARDDGDAAAAREHLASAPSDWPGVLTAREVDPAAWPEGLRDLMLPRRGRPSEVTSAPFEEAGATQ